MGKAAAFVCAVVLGIALVTSDDTESSSTTESTFIEENVLQNTTVQNGNKSNDEIKYTDNDNPEETNEREIPSQNSQTKGDVGKGNETESSSNSNSEGTRTKGRRKGTKRLKDKPVGRSASISEITSTPRDTDEDPKPDIPVCASPPDIEGAITSQMKGTEHPVGTRVTYNCPYGYVSRNSIHHVSVCVINPTTKKPYWRPPEITCIPRSCGDPGYMPNGRRIGNLFTFPNKVEYVCEEGYKLRGLSARYCQAGGDWSGVLPTCDQIYCKVPADPPNGRVRYSSLEYGTELRYECNVGYLLKKHQPRVCSEDGNWSNEEPECIEATCEEPEPPKFGSVKLHGDLKVGSLATYSCDPGRKLHGATTTKCLTSGKWTFDAPECLRSCQVPFIENGELGTYETRYSRTGYYRAFTKVPAMENVESQQTLAVRCKNGYTPVENSDQILSSDRVEVTCSNGSWSRDLQCKPTSCQGHPPPSKNARPVILKRNHGHTIYYLCDSAYPTKISGKVTCHFGSWTGIPPRCLNNPCYTKDLDYPGLAKPPEEHFDSSESFEINCERGYRKAARIQTISCVRGRWEISQNPCTSEREGSTMVPPIEEIQISRGGENQPGANVESSSPRTTEATRNPECFCSYEYKDSRVKMQTIHRILAQRDAVKFGETVWLECNNPNDRLKWKNGLVFSGKAFMTCSKCKQWLREDLPTCILPTSDTFITYDGDFKILPGGIISMQRRGSRRYECRSYWGQPIWDVRERQNVHTWRSQLAVNGGIYYIAYLEIIEASDHNNGEYECFLRDAYNSHAGSTYFNLQVHDEEDRSTTKTELGVLTGGTITQPSVNVETSTHQTSDAKLNEDCFCSYEYEYQHVKAQIGQKVLKVGDTIRRGERVSFECKYGDMALTWQNGLRLNGKANLICNTCKKWQWNDVPICKYYEKSEAVINFNNDLNVLPGGTVIVNKGERNQFYCTSGRTHPVWNYGQRRGVFVTQSTSFVSGTTYTTYYVSILDIGKQENDPSGEYECYVHDEHGQRFGSAFLRLEAYEAGILCPEIDRSGIFTLRYSNRRKINSTVTFHCKEDDKRVEGHNCLTCLPNGTWSGRIPKCVDYISCPEFTLTPGLNVNYSKNFSVGSVASFECSLPTKDLNGSSSSICLENGRWSNPLPSCEDQKCSIHDLGVSVPEDVQLDMSTVTEEHVILGFEVKLKCDGKYVITGDSKARCEKQGKWKLGSFQCVMGCVLDLDPSSHLLIEPQKESYRLGERITLSCPPGEVLSSDVEQLMCLSRSWSDSLPNCIEMEKKVSP